MDKPSNERGSTGPTDGIKAEGDAGNERHICKANPAMIDDIGKKHGLEDTSEKFSGKKYALAPKAATKFLKASRCYVALGKARRVLWWLGLLLLSPALILWAESRIQLVSATAGFGSACFDCSLAISSSHTSLGVL